MVGAGAGVAGERETVAVHEIRIDYSVPLGEEPDKGHNRWHPDIAPVVRCAPGDEVVLETRDALDLQVTRDSTVEDVGTVNLNVVHPLTGPVFIEGAEAGDLLVAEIIEVVPPLFGFTVQIPGFGFLREDFPEPFIVRWELAEGWATSEDLPGVRIPGAPFMGTIGLAPSRELMQQISAREQDLLGRGGMVLPPDATDAVPQDGAIAGEALRTIPPRETAGNVDIKQLSAGTRLLMPVFAQGDCSPWATPTSRRATARRAAPPSR